MKTGYNFDAETIGAMRKKNKPVMVYGSGNFALNVLDYLKSVGADVRGFLVDDKYYSEGMTLGGENVVPLGGVKSLDDYSIAIGFCNVPKSKFIMDNASIIKGDYYFLWQTSDEPWWPPEYMEEHEKDFLAIERELADSRSRDVLRALIRANVNRDYREIVPYVDEHQYFNRLTFVHDASAEVLVDCGAYSGDTIAGFSDFTDGRYAHIYSFEPNGDNLKMLNENIGDRYHDVTVIKKGTWSKECVLEFMKQGSGSSIKGAMSVTDGGDVIRVPVVALDEALGDVPVTFIKMDIEGSELETLRGARGIISRNMPRLAVCCYHKPTDIIDLYGCMKSFENEEKKYIFYLRQYSFNNTETVMYAIPVDKR